MRPHHRHDEPTTFRRPAAPLLGAVVLAAALAGCTGGAVDSSSAEQPAAPEAQMERLDEYELAELLPGSAEVEERLGWTDDDINYNPPDFSGVPADIDGAIEQWGGPIVLGVECADAMRATGVHPGGPIGATDIATGMWAEAESVRELWLARYPTAEAAAAQVEGLPVVVEGCPNLNGEPHAVLTTGVEGAAAFTEGSYSWVVASYGNLVAQVEVGTSDAERASGDALMELQLDKLELIARGEY